MICGVYVDSKVHKRTNWRCRYVRVMQGGGSSGSTKWYVVLFVVVNGTFSDLGVVADDAVFDSTNLL